MARYSPLVVLLVLLGPTAHSQIASSRALGLKSQQIPTDCKVIDGNFPVDMQTAILWDRPDLYKSVIPIPVAKTAQSFACQGDKGTVYFFQFGSEGERKTAAVFIRPLLWGELGPTANHPELVLEIGDILTVVSFRKTPKPLLAVLRGGAAPANTATMSKDFPIPGHGSLRLKVPDDWQSEARSLTDPASVTLHFVPTDGNAFDVQVTTVWLDSAKRIKETTSSLKAQVQRAAEALLPRSLEKTANLSELRGAQSVGFYYALTDRNPGPGEFSNLTQGEFLTGEVLSTFTILHRTSASPEVTQALQAFTEATYN